MSVSYHCCLVLGCIADLQLQSAIAPYVFEGHIEFLNQESVKYISKQFV
ncbi:MAG: hypothetical protein ACFE0I_03135 [Elainellaceae cyanobacterium]